MAAFRAELRFKIYCVNIPMVVEMLCGFPFEIFSTRPMLREIGLVSVQNRLQFC